MPLYSIPRRSFTPAVNESIEINWKRGLFRVWLLCAGAWIMSWVIRVIMNGLQNGFRASDILVIPILLFGPPIALLIFGVAAGWAFRGFKANNSTRG
jgi:hypothetical protein